MRRRELLTYGLAGATTLGLPRFTFAATPGERRLVLVILRGAMDGLALVPPIGDPHYASLRGSLAIEGPGQAGGALPLDDVFGLHPALGDLHGLYRQGQLLPIHAVASPYRERSHFDGQDVLESGSGPGSLLRDGWLNRALPPLGGAELALALAPTAPLVLRGTQAVPSWAPSGLPDPDDDTLRRVRMLYAPDPLLSERLEQALEARDLAGAMGQGRRSVRGGKSRQLFASAGRFLAADEGPRIAVLETTGWDTHANQGSSEGALARRFIELQDGLMSLRKELGGTWQHTAIAVVTEFGRTAAVNGTGGTDHGTGSAALLLGGAVRGGRVLADWPGLARRDLYEGRDLQPTLDLRSVFKGMLSGLFELDSAYLESKVFPDSRTAALLPDLIHS